MNPQPREIEVAKSLLALRGSAPEIPLEVRFQLMAERQRYVRGIEQILCVVGERALVKWNVGPFPYRWHFLDTLPIDVVNMYFRLGEISVTQFQRWSWAQGLSFFF